MNTLELVLLLDQAVHILLSVTSSQEVTQAIKVPATSSKCLGFQTHYLGLQLPQHVQLHL